MEYRVVSAGNRAELVQSRNELNLNPDSSSRQIVSHDGLLIAFYYA